MNSRHIDTLARLQSLGKITSVHLDSRAGTVLIGHRRADCGTYNKVRIDSNGDWSVVA
jgi:hypothetical protein